ncbi:hypothetical protein BN946_scf184803.g16 [Trametes cinnabarina]|uniref:Uncharacterized protein n=1 Tax=Pycnoporus cinnabarinus TaxID=5643 RepID=A0A060SBT3_PYCCI|nr:hypothetical protein BN946_scf184803.g16 [Trametes cinnabarina]
MSKDTSRIISEKVDGGSGLREDLPGLPSHMTNEESSVADVSTGENVLLHGESSRTPIVLAEAQGSIWPGALIHFWHIPGLALAYVVHARFRRFSPRRLPPLTPLKLPGVYGSLALWGWAGNASYAAEAEIDHHPALQNVKFIRDVNETLANSWRTKYGQQPNAEDLLGQEATSLLRAFIDEHYRDLSLVDKALWWHRNWRSYADVRVCAYVLWTKIGADTIREAPPDRRMGIIHDLHVCSSHLANTWSTDPEKDGLNYLKYPVLALIATIPFALLARRAHVPSLYQPLNGLQRLLVGAVIYMGPFQGYEHHSCLKRLKCSDIIAEAIRKPKKS